MNQYTNEIAVLGYFSSRNAGDDAFFDFWSKRKAGKGISVNLNFKGTSAKRAIMGGGAIINKYFLDRLPDTFEELNIVGCSLPYGAADMDLLNPYREKINLMYLRSSSDVQIAHSKGFSSSYLPDIIFSHEFSDEIKYDITDLRDLCSLPPAEYNPDRKNLIVCVSDHYRSEDLSQYFLIESFKYKLAQSLDVLSQYYNIIFLPMSIWYNARDNVFAADVATRMKARSKVFVIDKYLGPNGIYSVIKNHASLVVSMKYHGIVFSMHANKSFVNIGNTRKNIDLLRDNELDYLDCNTSGFSKEKFLETVKVAEANETLKAISKATLRNQKDISLVAPNIATLVQGECIKNEE